jgi:hypothetical protein
LIAAAAAFIGRCSNKGNAWCVAFFHFGAESAMLFTLRLSDPRMKIRMFRQQRVLWKSRIAATVYTCGIRAIRAIAENSG